MDKKFLTPEDIKNAVFSKARVSGYDMLAVDNFLEQVEASLSAYIEENKALKGKMVVLVNHIEELRNSGSAAGISAYKKENSELKSKMEVLADELVQYRNTYGKLSKNTASGMQTSETEEEEWLFDVTKF